MRFFNKLAETFDGQERMLFGGLNKAKEREL